MPRLRFRYIEMNPNHHGRMRFYFRKSRHEPRVRLPDTYGSPEFLQAYHAAALAAFGPVGQSAPPKENREPKLNAATALAISKLAHEKPGLSWKELRYMALRLHGGKCQCCGVEQKFGKRLHVDHIKPKSKFPELQWDLSNLQVLCQDCNLGKGAWDETDWRGKSAPLQ